MPLNSMITIPEDPHHSTRNRIELKSCDVQMFRFQAILDDVSKRVTSLSSARAIFLPADFENGT